MYEPHRRTFQARKQLPYILQSQHISPYSSCSPQHRRNLRLTRVADEGQYFQTCDSFNLVFSACLIRLFSSLPGLVLSVFQVRVAATMAVEKQKSGKMKTRRACILRHLVRPSSCGSLTSMCRAGVLMRRGGYGCVAIFEVVESQHWHPSRGICSQFPIDSDTKCTLSLAWRQQQLPGQVFRAIDHLTSASSTNARDWRKCVELVRIRYDILIFAAKEYAVLHVDHLLQIFTI